MSDITGEQGDVGKGVARTAAPQGQEVDTNRLASEQAAKQIDTQAAKAGTVGLCPVRCICHSVLENTVVPLLQTSHLFPWCCSQSKLQEWLQLHSKFIKNLIPEASITIAMTWAPGRTSSKLYSYSVIRLDGIPL